MSVIICIIRILFVNVAKGYVYKQKEVISMIRGIIKALSSKQIEHQNAIRRRDAVRQQDESGKAIKNPKKPTNPMI